jgi:hypothetical protein
VRSFRFPQEVDVIFEAAGCAELEYMAYAHFKELMRPKPAGAPAGAETA